MPDYKTLRGTSTFTYEEKRSRFIATAAFAAGAAEAGELHGLPLNG